MTDGAMFRLPTVGLMTGDGRAPLVEQAFSRASSGSPPADFVIPRLSGNDGVRFEPQSHRGGPVVTDASSLVRRRVR